MQKKTNCLPEMPPPRILLYPSNDAIGNAQGKFLQLVWQGREHLIFADAGSHDYHNQILAGFAAEQKLANRWITAERLELEHPELQVLGGGRFRLDRAAGSLDLWDQSQAYGRFREQDLAERIAAAECPWNVLRVTVR